MTMLHDDQADLLEEEIDKEKYINDMIDRLIEKQKVWDSESELYDRKRKLKPKL